MKAAPFRCNVSCGVSLKIIAYSTFKFKFKYKCDGVKNKDCKSDQFTMTKGKTGKLQKAGMREQDLKIRDRERHFFIFPSLH